jgi:hypothetical protein
MKPYIEEKWVYKVTRMMDYYHLCEDRLLTEQCENTQPSISITRPALLILHVQVNTQNTMACNYIEQ